MRNSSPPLDVPSEDSPDSPSGSSTSEPQDESSHIQHPLMEQSFFYKLDQLSPDNPLYFMQQQSRQPGQPSFEEDHAMAEASTESPSRMDTNSPPSQHSLDHHQAMSPQSDHPLQTTPQSLTMSHMPSLQQQHDNIVDPLQPATSATPETNQTFWSGVNNFLSNVTHNPFPQAIPNLARNFTDYLSSNYPVQLPGSFNSDSTAQKAQAPSPDGNATQTAPLVPRELAYKQDAPLDSISKSPGMQIRVLGVPQTGAKSRVETQIKLCIQLVTDDGDKAQWWSHLKLPETMVAKDKLKRQIMLTTAPNGTRIANVAGLDNNNMPIQPEKMLFLRARVICASDPSKKVVTCLGCIQRERKRSQRRKENRVKTETDEDKRPVDDEKSLALEEQKVLLFNCSEVVDFSSGDTILPTRITCYCRHHNERLGFCIYFEMLDHSGKQVATGMSPPIMITDDHKSNKVKAGRKRPRLEAEHNPQMMPTSAVFPPFNQQAVPSTMANVPALQAFNHFPNPVQQQQQQSPLQHQQPQTQQQQQQPSIQPRPEQDMMPVSNKSSPLPMEALLQQQMASMNADLLGPIPSNAQSVERNPSTSTSPVPPAAVERPQLQRLIPSEGPTFGGIEVTMLGTNFRPGLTVMFGEVAASTTHYWSPNTLVCILPPATEPGAVVVCFKEYPVMDSQDVVLFTYYNENDRALMELALQVVGLKMTGRVEDAREIAMRIVQGGNQNNQQQQNTSDTNGSSNGDKGKGQQHSVTNLERGIIQVLEVMDTMEDVQPDDVSMVNAQGHTMLHLAAMLGFGKLALALLDLGCFADATDKNGYTALHYAALYGHENVARILLEDGDADPEPISMTSKRPMHLAKDNTMRTLLLSYMPLVDKETSESSGYDGALSDTMSADVDTSFDEYEAEEDGEGESDADSVWLGGSDVEDERLDVVDVQQHLYLSDTSTTSLSSAISQEGLRRRRGRGVASIQYLQQEDNTCNSADEILDAEAVGEHAGVSSSDDEPEQSPKGSTWMQRTLSHFQQPKHQRAPSDSSFLQNLKNNMPAKPSDLGLKNIADHLLQLPRPTAMIANMSVLFSNEQRKTGTEEPEQTLAWYMALAYAMGARSNSQQETTSQRPNRKQHHVSAYVPSTTATPANPSTASATPSTSSSIPSVPAASSSYDSFYTSGLETMEDRKRRDQRLFSFWVPLLCLMVIWLVYQVASNHSFHNLFGLLNA